MALLLKEYEDEYGRQYENLYCKITNYRYDIMKKEIVFSIQPFVSEAAREAGKPPLPIGELDLGGIVSGVEPDDDILAKCYEWIHGQIKITEDEDAYAKAHDPDSVEGLSEAEHNIAADAYKWRTYQGAEDA